MDVSTITNTSPFFWGYLGAASSLVFSGFGAAIGTYKSAEGIVEMDKRENELPTITSPPTYSSVQNTNTEFYQVPESSNSASLKNLIPIIISGVLAIYGLIFSVVSITAIDSSFTSEQGFATFGAGLAVGLSCLASGIAVGVVAKSGLPKAGNSSSRFVALVLMLVFCEAIGLYGLITSLIAQTTM